MPRFTPGKVNVYLWPGPLDKLLNSPSGDVGRYLAKVGEKIEAAAKRQVGVDTGALRASIHTRHTRHARGQQLKIGSELKHAYVHHEGTKPHMIYQDPTKMMRFVRKGQITYAHSVFHPGTKANRYLSDNLKLVR